jgi:hypothetical protein
LPVCEKIYQFEKKKKKYGLTNRSGRFTGFSRFYAGSNVFFPVRLLPGFEA